MNIRTIREEQKQLELKYNFEIHDINRVSVSFEEKSRYYSRYTNLGQL